MATVLDSVRSWFRGHSFHPREQRKSPKEAIITAPSFGALHVNGLRDGVGEEITKCGGLMIATNSPHKDRIFSSSPVYLGCACDGL